MERRLLQNQRMEGDTDTEKKWLYLERQADQWVWSDWKATNGYDQEPSGQRNS